MPFPGYSAIPLVQLLAGRLGLARSLADSAVETRLISPGLTEAPPRAIFLDGQLDRVTGVDSTSSLDLERIRLGGVPVTHLPTLAFRIEDAVFSAGRLLTPRLHENQGGTQKRRLIARITEQLDSAAFPLNLYATLFFGHMVLDGAAAMMLAPPFAPACIDATVSAGMAGHVDRYFQIFGLAHRAVRDVRVHNAWLFDDRGMNPHKSARLRTLGEKVRALPGRGSGHGVFFRRRGWGARRAPENEAELEDFFAARDFDIVDAAGLGVDDIIARIRGARVLVGVEGSGLTHGMLAMEPGATVVMLMPPWRLNNMMKDYSDGLGLRHAFVIGTEGRGGYVIDPDEILRTMDLAGV
ncbi:MAG: glycosyltransferase family 61 protein [Paracoccaceae bacterium]